MTTITRNSAMSRRDLLQTGGALLVSFAIGGTRRSLAQTAATQGSAAAKPVDPKEVDSFLAVHADGSVTIYCGKVDVGTGLRIAVRQMAAEELGVPVERISMVEGDSATTPDQGSTGGSTGSLRGARGSPSTSRCPTPTRSNSTARIQ